ncbi:hypothetical protein DL96DRAFT_871127 [Flagelloscypha sp. PMI_526]|nr:hypothetical protein DL96DRAFT_871127 [Flagelloscypha sp. PMI_526]
MLLVTLVMFSSSTVLWALNVSWTLLRIKGTLVHGWNMTWEDRSGLVAETKLTPLGTPMEALFMLNMLIGDAVVVSRAKAVWNNSWKIIAVPCLFLVTALAFSILGVVCLEIEGFGNTTADVVGSYACRRAEPIAWALSIITNVISTSLIAFRAWNHRKVINHAYPRRRTASPVEKALMLVVESGFVYILLLISQLAVFWEGVAAGNAASYAFAVIAPLGDQITVRFSPKCSLVPWVINPIVFFSRVFTQHLSSFSYLFRSLTGMGHILTCTTLAPRLSVVRQERPYDSQIQLKVLYAPIH